MWQVRIGGRSVASGDEPDRMSVGLEPPASSRIVRRDFHPSTEPEPAIMRVTVIGAGHVGLVTAACLAHVGHDVVVDDDDASKLDLIHTGGRAWFRGRASRSCSARWSGRGGSGWPATRPRRSGTGR